MPDDRRLAPLTGVSHEHLAAQIDQLEARRAADAHTLTGRFADLERKVEAQGGQLADLRVESGKQTTQLEFLVSAEEERRERAQVDHATNQIVKVEGEKQKTAVMTTKGKLITALVSVITALGTYFASH